MGFPALGVLLADDAPGDSGSTVVGRMTLQVTVVVPVAWGRGKENELFRLEGTDRFIRFIGRTAGSSVEPPVQTV